MDNDLKQIFRFTVGILAAILLLGGFVTLISGAFNLAWMPWQVKMQTSIIRNSNSYVTTQQSALRQFRLAYDDAETQAQRIGIVRQMREIADTIPADVQPDVASFLAAH